ncbi:MAG: carboxypeptidase-like regulatory domain-containing protein, partial [Acidobacteriota bacterium]
MRLFDPGRWFQFPFFIFFLFSSISFSQNTLQLEGTVRDAAGSAIGQVSISLLNARQTVLQAVQTDRQGEFVFSGVAPGSYELLVSGGR